jgi:uncharacterized cupin superfamily protein
LLGVSDPDVFTASCEYDAEDPDGYRAGVAAVGQAAGQKELIVKVYEIPGGQSLCPYHYEYLEEWLVVLSGEVELRDPDGSRPVSAGALICFPTGPAGAHKLTAGGDAAARVMMFSSSREPAVAVYPDSDKVGVWTDNERDEFMFRRPDGQLPYYDGEV